MGDFKEQRYSPVLTRMGWAWAYRSPSGVWIGGTAPTKEAAQGALDRQAAYRDGTRASTDRPIEGSDGAS